MTQREQRKAAQLRVRKITFSALYLALALVLPFLTGQIPEIGSMLCPMHIPALLCGFACGWPWGLTVGFISPLLRSVIFGMPKLFPSAVAMAFEMAVYGAVAGILYRKLPEFKLRLYVILIIAMISGRLVWGGVQFLIAAMMNIDFTIEAFLAGAITSSLPGILLQLVIIPPLVAAMNKTDLNLNKV